MLPLQPLALPLNTNNKRPARGDEGETMASTTLEAVRAQHEELERFEKGIMQQLNAASSGLDRAGRKLSKKRE